MLLSFELILLYTCLKEIPSNFEAWNSNVLFTLDLYLNLIVFAVNGISISCQTPFISIINLSGSS